MVGFEERLAEAMKLRRWFLRITTPIQKLLQHIHRPPYRVRGEFYWSIKDKLRNGDVLLSREDWHLTNWFIPGFWKHAAIVSHDHVIEAVGEGVQAVRIPEWILTKDYVAVLRPIGLDASRAGIWAAEQVGKKYDYLFGRGDKEFFCSELVNDALRSQHNLHIQARYTKGIVLPSDFMHSGALTCIAYSRDDQKPNPYRGKYK